jgi:hypothetical protein
MRHVNAVACRPGKVIAMPPRTETGPIPVVTGHADFAPQRAVWQIVSLLGGGGVKRVRVGDRFVFVGTASELFYVMETGGVPLGQFILKRAPHLRPQIDAWLAKPQPGVSMAVALRSLHPEARAAIEDALAVQFVTRFATAALAVARGVAPVVEPLGDVTGNVDAVPVLATALSALNRLAAGDVDHYFQIAGVDGTLERVLDGYLVAGGRGALDAWVPLLGRGVSRHAAPLDTVRALRNILDDAALLGRARVQAAVFVCGPDRLLISNRQSVTMLGSTRDDARVADAFQRPAGVPSISPRTFPPFAMCGPAELAQKMATSARAHQLSMAAVVEVDSFALQCAASIEPAEVEDASIAASVALFAAGRLDGLQSCFVTDGLVSPLDACGVMLGDSTMAACRLDARQLVVVRTATARAIPHLLQVASTLTQEIRLRA